MHSAVVGVADYKAFDVTNLDVIFSAQPREVRTNRYVERALVTLRTLSIEERLRGIKSLNAGVVWMPYLHATSSENMQELSYQEIAASLPSGFPRRIGALYLHFPFCTKKCRFCHYYKDHSTSQSDRDEFPRYLAVELGLLRAHFGIEKISAETIHFGGGSPSLLSPDSWRHFVEGIARHVDFSGTPEIAIEADPEDVNFASLQAWLATGVNRVSLGIQSFDANVLEYLRRGHGKEQAIAAVDLIAEAGVPNINIDLMYGMPNRSLASWVGDLEQIQLLKPHSVTCYATRPDPRNILEKAQDFPTDIERIFAHQIAIEAMMDVGYFQYSPNQFIASHQGACLAKEYRNRCADVLGIGPRAHSIFQGWFYENFVGHPRYRDLMIEGKLCPLKGKRIAADEEKRRFLQFGLKLSGLDKPDPDNGVLVADYESRFGSSVTEDFRSALDAMTELGLVTPGRDHALRLTHAGVVLNYEVGRFLGEARIETPEPMGLAVT